MATATVFPSADGMGGPVDPGNGNSTFSIWRSTTSNFIDSTGVTLEVLVRNNSSSKYDIIERGIILFDTSFLTAGAVITSAVLSVFGTARVGSINGLLNIVSSNPASTGSLVATDFNIGNFGSTLFSTGQNVSAMSATGYNDFTLNASGLANINQTGISKFALLTEADITNTSPLFTNNNLGFDFSSSRQTGTSQDPKLVITYTPAPSTATPAFLLNFI